MKLRDVNFKDFITLQRGFDLPKSKMKEGAVPVLGSNCVIGYHNEAKVSPPGVVTGRSGTLGLVQYSDELFWPHNTSLWVKDFNGNFPKYVYYKLKTLHLENFNGGASVPTLNRNVLDNLSVKVPDPEVQKRIADTLSVYDELLENNRRRMALLEESARLLYQEWFVHLRFPGHEHTRLLNRVPEGWNSVPLGERVILNYGKALKSEERVDGSVPVYGSSGIVGSHEKPLAKGPAIILGRKGNVGSVFWSSKDFYAIDTVYYVNAETSNLYLFYALKHMHFISTDVAVPGLNRGLAYSRPLLIPSKIILSQFLEAVVPMHEQLDKLEEINTKLKAARDILLPRLMSGEIGV